MREDLSERTPLSTKISLFVAFLLLTAANAFCILRGGDFDFTLQKWGYAIGFSALLSGLLCYVLFVLLPRERFRAAEHGAAFYPLIAGFLGLLCMALSYIWLGVWPFGKESVMIVDLHHQYGPMLSELREMLQNGGDVLYTFKTGIGANFISLFAYYLASPFNLLLLLFPPSLLTEGVLVITLLKNALTAALFAACLQYVLRQKGLYTVMLALCYSLSMYALAYSWNIMWLDAVMMLPLAVLGFERMMRTGKYGVYILSLAYILITNYYIGFMVCLFLVLYYIAFALRRQRSAAAQGHAFLRFAVGSLIGGGLAMAILLPVFFALRYTSAVGETLPELGSNFDIFKLFARLLFGTTPTIRSGKLPNIYCGILPLTLLPLFFTVRSIPLRRRLAYGGLLAVMSLSCTLNLPNLIWHGLHSPNDLPYRFSFLFIFTVLFLAGMLFPHMKDITPRQIFATVGGLCAAIVLYEALYAKNTDVFLSVYVSLLLVVLYGGILLLFAYRRLAVRAAAAVLMLAVTLEMTVSGGLTLDTLNGNEYYTDHDAYVDNAETRAAAAAVAEMNAIGDKEQGEGFYRAELLPRRTCVDTALFHYRGLTSFSSSNYYRTTRFLGSLGYACNGVNSYLYESFMPTADSLLGIRYLALSTDLEGHAQLEKAGESHTDDGDYIIYRNKLALPIAYRVSPNIADFTARRYHPFATQEALLAAMTDDSTPLYTYADITTDDSSLGTASAYGTQFSISGENGGTGWFTAAIESRAAYYVYVDCLAAKSASVTVTAPDGTETNLDASTDEPYIVDAGTLTEGTVITVSVTADTAVSGNIYVAALDTALLEKHMTALAADGMRVTAFSDSRIDGTLTASANGAVFTSVPYDTGWTVTVDGEKVETYSIGEPSKDGTAGAFLSFDIGVGEHEISLRYVPRGLYVGLLLSAVSLVAFILLLIITGRKKRKDPLVLAPMQPATPLPVETAPSPLTDTVTLETLLTDGDDPTEE